MYQKENSNIKIQWLVVSRPRAELTAASQGSVGLRQRTRLRFAPQWVD